MSLTQQEYQRRHYIKHRERLILKRRVYVEANPEKAKLSARKAQIKRTYGITLDEYEFMCKKQNYKCAICERPETATYRGEVRKLSVDHCHETGKVRGLLCSSCNLALGGFEDNSDYLTKAIKYLGEYHSD